MREGDSLWQIAVETMGSGVRWAQIYDVNRALIGDDPGDLRLGMVLHIPAQESETASLQ